MLKRRQMKQDVLGDETEEEETKPIELPVEEEEPPEKTVDVAAEKKVVKITSEIPQTERMQRGPKDSMYLKSEDDENLKKRKERFGIATSSAGTGTTEDTDAKKRKRAEHFGIAR
ncbi:hypothetical protein P7K49_005371 [Saguinus oedipus]|uniref:THO1-MOS11 C-terminal domain-containing protein n=1 Tax=Saguinus oedipus TaxID=9490 RepID=A0ABQ9WA43_SAGOE|nr:hypothetical protein P7K49_005371 [Saguinus oedipus]